MQKKHYAFILLFGISLFYISCSKKNEKQTGSVNENNQNNPINPIDPTAANNCLPEEQILKQPNFWGIIPYYTRTPQVSSFMIDVNIDELPQEMACFQNLRILSVNAKVKSYVHLKLLQNLRHLNFNQNSVIPKEIGTLTKLVSLSLTDAIPSEIKYLQELRFLNINLVNTTIIPKEIGDLKALFSLRIFIFGAAATVLPDEIGNLTQLGTLDLSSSQLKEVPASLSNLKRLSFLNLINNQLTSLPDSFKSFRNIHIDLRNNKFTDDEKNKIKAWFKPENEVVLEF